MSFRLSYDLEDELPPEEPYELWLYLVYVTDKTEYSTITQEIAHNLKTDFLNLLEKTEDCGTVILSKCEALSEMESTVHDIRNTVEYHLEHLSYRAEPLGPVI